MPKFPQNNARTYRQEGRRNNEQICFSERAETRILSTRHHSVVQKPSLRVLVGNDVCMCFFKKKKSMTAFVFLHLLLRHGHLDTERDWRVSGRGHLSVRRILHQPAPSMTYVSVAAGVSVGTKYPSRRPGASGPGPTLPAMPSPAP